MSSLPPLLTKGKLVSHVEGVSLDDIVPIEHIINWFQSRLTKTGIENRILLLLAETASGKSTIIPPTIYRRLVRGQPDNSPGVICTQPRIMTAQENLNEMLKYNKDRALVFGDTCGWSTGPSKIPPIRNASFLSATVGTLAAQLTTMTDDELIQRYKYILIDETHERDLDTDMTIYALKNLILRNASRLDCPFVVLMSATFKPEPFLKYFGVSTMNNFIHCAGEAYEKTTHWDVTTPLTNYLHTAAETVRKICMLGQKDEVDRGDILIFVLPSDYPQLEKMLYAINDELSDKGVPVFSVSHVNRAIVQERGKMYRKVMNEIPTQKQLVKIKGKKYVPNRKVILGNVVVETGLTLDGLKYVIDAGFHQSSQYDPVADITFIDTTYAPQPRGVQRKGRAGRKFAGHYYPLYPPEVHAALPVDQLPAILTEDCSRIMIRLIEEQLKQKTYMGQTQEFLIQDIDMVDQPPPDMLLTSLEKFYKLGYISYAGVNKRERVDDTLIAKPTDSFGITKLGHLYSSIADQMSPEDFRMIIAGFNWGIYIPDLITMVAWADTDKPLGKFYQADPLQPINWHVVYDNGLPFYLRGTAQALRTKILTYEPYFDGMIVLEAIKMIGSQHKSEVFHKEFSKWCVAVGLDFHKIVDFVARRDELLGVFLVAGFDIFRVGITMLAIDGSRFMDYIARIKHCIYDGYRMNVLKKHGAIYKTTKGLEVIVPPMFTTTEQEIIKKHKYDAITRIAPDILIYRKLNFKANRKTGIYQAIPTCVSAMDGFVSVDI